MSEANSRTPDERNIQPSSNPRDALAARARANAADARAIIKAGQIIQPTVELVEFFEAVARELSDEPNSAVETSAPLSDEALRVIWRMHGGEFHGPNVETGTMPEATLLPLLRSLIKARPLPPAGDSVGRAQEKSHD